MQTELLKTIREEVEKISLVDTHEHFLLEEERLNTKLNLFYLFPHYASSDLLSSGMSPQTLDEIRISNCPLEEKWEKFKAYWERIKNTAYSKALLIAVKDLFGIGDINEHTYRRLSEKIAASNKKGWYRYVLRERANVDVSIVDFPGRGILKREAPRIERRVAREKFQADKKIPSMNKDFLVPVAKFDEFITIRSLDEIRRAEEEYDIATYCLDDLLKILDCAFEKRVEEGIVGVKTALAYIRILKYEKTPKYEAEILFNHIFQDLGEGLSWKEAKPLQDFMMHQVIRRAINYNLPIQIHTGLQEGNGNIITNSDPTHLLTLFIEYNKAIFDVFHAGYPYTGELTAIAKNFPNVYVDMCWLHVISPSVARRVLEEWIEQIPSNKIFGFGGDYIIVEGAYAHSRLARDNVARVLAKKVKEGYLKESEAVELGHKILRDNAYKVFKLGSKTFNRPSK
ncbi:MAG: amidohydrolase family protein [bacterium]